ncbi:hypothetical protein Sango_2876600 [Sesamum angolense]|uniref:DUF7803 domain-containing protein n=1 Tax=Sesamum angolense TaxID=2727404 RepID=A0AAE1VVH6_9LAMI|nr:hypothetical protein Sango_2876600 [Sesamum angolense]
MCEDSYTCIYGVIDKVLIFLKFAVVSTGSLLSKAFRRALCVLQQVVAMDMDSKPTIEETVLVGDDMMMGPHSPLILPEIASHVLEGLQINDIEPFCQDEIAIYRQCAERRTKLKKDAASWNQKQHCWRAAAMYSASVEDCATVACFLEAHVNIHDPSEKV